MQQRFRSIAAVAMVLAFLGACSAPTGSPGPAPAANAPAASGSAIQTNPVDSVQLTQPVTLTFWHRQVGASEALQQQLIDEFMAQNPNIKINAESLGDYNKLYDKIIASIQAGSPPDLVAAYENQAADYYEAGALVPFDDYIHSAKYGLTTDELNDYIPSYIEATHFSQYDGKQLTFPYTKSDLVLYTNMDLARSLGFDKPPVTWDDFLAMCRASVTSGHQGYAMAVDASGFDGVVFSFGGDVISADGKTPLFDQPASVKALQLYETLAREKLAYQATGIDDQNDVTSGKTLFMMRSSTSVPFLAAAFKDDGKWAVSVIPQGTAPSATTKPVTVLYGANVSIMKTTPEKQLAAWTFIKWLTRPEVTARWGLDTSNGYFPVRQSTLQQQVAAEFLSANQRFKDALDVSRNGKVEPSAHGWAEVRTIIQDGMTGILTGRMTAAQAQQQMMQRATVALAA